MATYANGPGGDVDTAQDTYLSYDATTRNFGASDILICHSGFQTPLLFFDLSGIPAGSTCNAVTLYLYRAMQSSSNPHTLNVHAIASGNSGWIEGTKNDSTAGAGEPCWDAKEADGTGGVTTAWAGSAGMQTSGTDYEASSLGALAGDRSDAVGTEYAIEFNATGIARVEDWFGATNTNYGLILRTVDSAGQLASSDHATSGYHPKLVVDYTAAASGQFARPASDVADGNWLNQASSNTNLYASIDEETASDADYIRSGSSPSDDTCTVGLSAIETPAPGTVTLRIRARYL